MAPKFGTSGLRGLVTELTDPLCATYAEAFLSLAETDGSVLIGRDLRSSSQRIAQAVAGGAARLGLRAVDCGVLPTPALALEAAARGTAAVMVTGSHIPDDRNGLKFYTKSGEITKDDETAITRAKAALAEEAPGQAALGADRAAIDRYVSRFTGFFAADALQGLRIGVYEHSSAARDILPTVLKALGAETVSLARSDHFIPVDTEAVDAETRRMLGGWASEHGLDAIVSTDGDADRPMVADASGTVIPGDILGPLTAKMLGADTLVTPVNSNTLVDLMGGFRVVRTRIGSPFVIAGMEESAGRVVGYEANGGFLTGFAAEHNGSRMEPLATRDSVLPIIAPLALARASDQSLAELVETLPARRTAADRLQEVPTRISGALVAELQESAALRDRLCDGLGPPTSTDLTDGCRMGFGTTFVHLRPSGNAPELRVYVEAEGQDAADAILADTLTRLRAEVARRT